VLEWCQDVFGPLCGLDQAVVILHCLGLVAALVVLALDDEFIRESLLLEVPEFVDSGCEPSLTASA
jgi:hypothetical protein